MEKTLAQRVLWVLWPAFLVAGVAELVFFAAIDPDELHLLGAALDVGRMPIYTLGFVFFWAICAAASALTVFLRQSPFEVNRRPPENEDWPPGSPRRTSGNDVS